MPIPITSPDALLFDLDGTLLDTAPDLIAALDYVLKSKGFEPCDAVLARAYASHGAVGLLKFGLGDDLQAFDINELRQMFLQFYRDNIAVKTRLFDGIAALLSEVDEAGIPWGVVTNKPIELTQKLMPAFVDFANCRVMVGGDSLEHRKPHPEPLLHAAQTINVNPDACWYVGDAERDIEAANRADMFSVIADWGYIGHHDQPERWNADISMKSPFDLIKLLPGH